MPSGLRTGIGFSLQYNLPMWLWSLCAPCFWGDQLRNGRAGAWTAGSPNSLQAGVVLIHSQSITQASLVSANECQPSKSTWQKKATMEKNTLTSKLSLFLLLPSYYSKMFCTVNWCNIPQCWSNSFHPKALSVRKTTAGSWPLQKIREFAIFLSVKYTLCECMCTGVWLHFSLLGLVCFMSQMSVE